jgi:hypothetical protein
MIITPKLEIQTQGQREIIEAGTLAKKGRCSAIVVPPELVQGSVVDREMKKADYMVIAAIDFPGGREYALDKFRGLTEDVWSADGFEVVLSKRGEAALNNEITTLTELIRQYNSLASIRFVFSPAERSEGEVKACSEQFKERMPHFVRVGVDFTTTVPVNKTKEEIQKLTAKSSVAVKVCGLEREKEFECCQDLLQIQGVQRIGVTLEQATKIFQIEQKKNWRR